MVNSRIPKHIAIIPDGNRRWARGKGLLSIQAYMRSGSYENLKLLFGKARELGVEHFSIWGFSTDNWTRSKSERKAVFERIIEGINGFIKDSTRERIRFRHIGRKDRLPKEVVNKLEEVEEMTRDYDEFCVYLCIDYGGRDEIIRAVNRMLREGIDKISENDMVSFFDDSEMPDLDLLIRTSGEKRTSGLYPWHGVYAEFYSCDKFFPEFTPEDLEKAIIDYGNRERRFGGN